MIPRLHINSDTKVYPQEIMFFESDEEFTDFCVKPYAVIEMGDDNRAHISGDYSEQYLQSVAEGKEFVIKDEDSVVFKRQCVCKRVPVKGVGVYARRGQTTLVELPVENLRQYWSSMFDE